MVSLHNHLALVTLRQGHGSLEQVSELLKTVYLTNYCDVANTPEVAIETYLCAELALIECVKCISSEQVVQLDQIQCGAIEKVLAVHDAQLACLPRHRIDNTRKRLSQIMAQGKFPRLQGLAAPLD
ncbi:MULTISPECIES: hypothetical protein [unclassified Caballeronia]|uniref:hypothetical protein n=1 Tax=unclassified Caballeronia TaxID=2646786 RepID=UPI00202867EC|nr:MULTISPECIES: hypothetical protein [unclassified Caballeronia]